MQQPSPAHSIFAAALLVATTIVPVSAVQGQGELALEEVIVTAQRRETTLQTTPVAVTAFTAEKITELGIYDITDLSGLAPNTNIQKQPSSNSNMSIYIRGVGSGETALTVDPKTSFYIDGVYVSKTVGAVFDLVDLERIEVLRGPQGTLFGRNSTGGAINVSTVKPTGESGGRLEASLGNDGYQRIIGSFDLPKIGDMLSIKFSGMNMEYDGWATNSFPGQARDLASEDNDSWRLALRLQPIDALTIDYSYDNTDNVGVPAPFQLTEVKTELYNPHGPNTQVPFTTIGGSLFTGMQATIDDNGGPKQRREQYELDGVSDEFLEVVGHSLTAALELGDITLKYIAADRETKSGYASTDLDGGAYTTTVLTRAGFNAMGIPTPANAMGAVLPVAGFHAALDGFIEMTSHELQIIGSALAGRLQYTAGLFYYEEKVYQNNAQNFSLPIENLLAGAGGDLDFLRAQYAAVGITCGAFGCVGSQQLPLTILGPNADLNVNGVVDFMYGQDTESRAAYGQFSFAIIEALELTAGLRYTEDDKSAFLNNENVMTQAIAEDGTPMFRLDDPTRPVLVRAGRLENDDSWDNISYLFNLKYAVSDDFNVYLTHSTGYNGGSFNARAASVSGWAEQVDEETISSWELGLKSQFFNDRVRANVAIFYNTYEDIQIAQFEAGAGGASSRLLNAGEATYQGLELDLEVILAKGLVFDLAWGYLDAEFDEYLARNPADEIVDISGVTTVGRAPEHTLNAGLQYDFPRSGFGQLSARLDATYTDEMVFHPFNNQFDSADERTLYNARLSLADIAGGGLRISAWVKNLTDEEYREWGIDFGGLGYAGAVFGRPRTYGIDVAYKF